MKTTIEYEGKSGDDAIDGLLSDMTTELSNFYREKIEYELKQIKKQIEDCNEEVIIEFKELFKEKK